MSDLPEAPRTVLYISYTGLMEPLGQSQVYQYLRKLAERHRILLITYEKPEHWGDQERVQAMRERTRSAGIEWHPLPYHQEPSVVATAWDLLRGFARGAYLCARRDVQVVHARSYVVSVLALLFQRLFGTRFVFDMRGFWADERVDGGRWPANGRLYRTAKWFEAQFLTNADVVVSLTEAGIEAMRAFDHVDTRATRFEMIPTCVDLELFTPEPSRREERFVLGYVGAAGGWHCFDEVVQCFDRLQQRRPDSHFLVLNQGQHDHIRERLAAHDISADQVTVKAVDYAEVPAEMNRIDAGIFFYVPKFSKKGTSPTKMGEFLACGIPCISNAAVGDVQSILEGNNIGVALDGFSDAQKQRAIDRILDLTAEPEIIDRCRNVAESYYSLEAGVRAYDEIYFTISDEGRHGSAVSD